MKLLWLALLTFLMSTGLLVYHHQQRQHPEVSDNVRAALEARLQYDSTVLSSVLQSDHIASSPSSLDGSPFYIEILRGDSLLYWNDKTQSSDGRFAPEKLVEIRRDSLSGIISFSPSEICIDTQAIHICLQPEVRQKVGSLVLGVGSLDPGSGKLKETSTITFRGKAINMQNSEKHNGSLATAIAWILLFTTLILFTVNRYKKLRYSLRSKQPSLGSAAMLLAVQVAFLVLHYIPWFSSLFEGFSWFETINETSMLWPDLAHLVVVIWIFGVLIALMRLYLHPASGQPVFEKIFALSSGFYLSAVFGISLYLIGGFVQHASVHLDMEDLIEFNSTSFILVLAFCVLMLLIFQSTLHLSEISHKTTLPKGNRMLWQALGWLSGVVLVFVALPPGIPLWIFIVFIASYALVIDAYAEIRDRKITYLIWWMILFSGFLAINLFYFGLQKDIRSRTEFADNYFSGKDEAIIRELAALQDSLIQRNVFNTLAAMDASVSLDRDDVYQFLFGKSSGLGASGKYTMELFDRKSGSTIFANHFADYQKVSRLYETSAPASGDILYNPLERLYVLRFEIDRSLSENSSWYLYVIRYADDFSDAKKNTGTFGYAIFKNGQVLEKNNHVQAVPPDSLLFSVKNTTIRDGFSFVVSKTTDTFRLVTWKKVSGLIKPISLFSFIFTLCGLVLLLLTILNTRYEFLPANISVKFGRRSSLKTKIQLAIILLILFTFLIIGAITGFYFTNLIEANQSEQKREESAAVINNIRSGIQQIADNENALIFLKSKLKDLAEIHNKNLSLYNADGSLLASTHSRDEYTRVPYALFSNPTKGYSLTSDTHTAEKTEYYPLLIYAQKPFAYISIRHAISTDSSGSILTFLSTILNAYIFLFLIAGAIAITIANSITQPLSILAEKLKKFKLGKTNEVLEWNSQDEIGTLIKDYNNLTRELERSAGLLAKTERDMAWREMAKQVAHEIKNPLTPMKLSIQYLEKASREQPEKAQDLIPRISSTLIEQIDNLSQIAGEFSNFASLPQASNEKVILNEVVAAVHDLFRKRDDMDINMLVPIDDLFVFADRNHLVRILNNLLKNAIQAIPENRRGKIEIELKRKDNEAVIRISDNGTGIPKSMRDKVFTPNFTTKSSGTGLGLAISANMIESCNGRIYFETEEGKGTDFYMAIPLMRLDDYLSDDQFVSLD
jgi:two-component system nitrogen regulation sensor histidine kinase NtrY